MPNPVSPNPAGRFAAGFFSPFQSGRFLLQHPRLIRFILFPLSINILVFTAAVWAGLKFFAGTVTQYLPQGDAWYWALVTYLVWFLAVLLTMVLVFFSFSLVGALLASPFNDLLSERTEELITGFRPEQPFQLRGFLIGALQTLADESRKIFLFLTGMALLLLLNLLPGIGTVLFGVLSVLWTLVFLVIEYTGYIASRKGMRLAAQRHYLLQRKLAMLGFGCGLLCLLAVPLLQFLTIPLGVIAATRLWCADPPQAETEVE
ncbi:EI24 domain-containing protein [Desulfuromonas carbonis]|uniref:EI24 domain-containing protein n=1 Tax=Desulfuromonas sp. DDH964 TaxID=1823759 RepID=UPI00078BB07F|nr:EI24 domain-containing protein [Desulfuromonas sp. DDH964]AMV71716.1 Protein CysZ [Desulfuromonas sp. DDH964]